MNKPVTVRTLLGDYPVTQPLKKGEVKSPSVSLDFADVKTVSTAFKRVVRNLEFDCAELAIVSFLMAKAYGKPLVLLPAVVLARFQHPHIVYNVERGLLAPADLAGRRVGTRSYTVTTSTWLRGILANDYGVDLERVKWVTFEEAHVAEFKDPPWVERAPEGKELVAMLLADRPAAEAAHSRSGEGGRGLAQEIRRAADQPHGGSEGFPVEIRPGRGARDLSAPRREQDGGEAAEAGRIRHQSVRPRGEPAQPRGRHRLRPSAAHDPAALRRRRALRRRDAQAGLNEERQGMIIDCHGHYTTAPKQLEEWRKRQIAALEDSKHAPYKGTLGISDDEIRASLEGAQLKQQRERGTDLTIFSPRAMGMSHHIGNETTSRHWSEHCNELIHRACSLYPENFVGVCQLPQSPGVSPANCIAELERCVKELGFIGCNLNPDPSGGYWKEPPLTDKWWYPLYEKMVELEVPAMVHVSASCNPSFHATGAHYINGDTTAFMQFVTGDLFRDFPTLKFIIPHGGGAVPYHWGRYRGLAQDMKRPPLAELVMNNVFFDTCVYHQPGIDLLLKVIPADNILFASEMVGAVKGVDPE